MLSFILFIFIHPHTESLWHSFSYDTPMLSTDVFLQLDTLAALTISLYIWYIVVYALYHEYHALALKLTHLKEEKSQQWVMTTSLFR